MYTAKTRTANTDAPMSSASQNSSTQSLMGFSVLQPALGAALEFFPIMGSQQLDELIDAYIVGPASILEKRTAVSLEFFEHALQSGEMYKFFLVYPNLNSNTTSPASTMHDSGYASSLNTSPVVAGSQWSQMTYGSFDSTAPTAKSSSKKAKSLSSKTQTGDFSHIPGMKIMTKEGLDVTNAASRGCKTREQRDHAHLMRIIRACDSCKRKKTRCDPSHKKRGSSAAGSPEPKPAKKVRKAASPPSRGSPAASAEIHFDTTFNPSIPESFSFDADFVAAPDLTIHDWDQFVEYDEEFNDMIPQDYDFFSDPARYFSPATTTSNSFSSASVSPDLGRTPGQSRPVTPASGVEYLGASPLGSSQQPTLPYLHQESSEASHNYVDFALYSPASTSLDDDLREIATPRGPGSSERQQLYSRRRLDVQSPLLSEVASTIADDTLQTLHGIDHNAFALERTSSPVQEALAPSDRVYYDSGHDRDQGSQRLGSLPPVDRARAGGLAGPAESRVPSMTVVPSDTLLRLPSPPGSQRLPLGSGSDIAIGAGLGVDVTGLWSITADDYGDDSIIAVSGIRRIHLDLELIVEQETGPSFTHRTTDGPLATARAVRVSPVSRESPSSGGPAVESVVRQGLPAGLRHQRRFENQQSGKPYLVAIHAGSAGAIQQASPSLQTVTDGIATGLCQTTSRDSTGLGVGVVQNRSSQDVGTGFPRPQGEVTQATVTPIAGLSQGVMQTTSSPLSGVSDGLPTGLPLVNGRLAVSATLGLKSTLPSSTDASGNADLGLLPVLAVLSYFLSLAYVLCQGLLPHMVTSLVGNGLSISSAVIAALPLAVSSNGSQQYSVSCMNKLDLFTPALQSAHRFVGRAINNIKSHIHGLQCGILNNRRRTMPTSLSRGVQRNNTARVAMVY